MVALEVFEEEGTEAEQNDTRFPVLRYQDRKLSDLELVDRINDPMTDSRDRAIHEQILQNRRARRYVRS